MERSTCPLDRVFEFKTKSGVVYEGPWRLHTGSLGAFVPKPDPKLYNKLHTLVQFKETKKGTLRYEGAQYRRRPGPNLVWTLSPNDANFLFVDNLRKGHEPNPNRHLHTDFNFADRDVHIDYVGQSEGAYGGFKFIVFSNDQFVARGGRYYTKYYGRLFNWGIAAYIGDSLITIEDPFEVGGFEFRSLNIRFWAPK